MIPVPPIPDLQLAPQWHTELLHRRRHAQDMIIGRGADTAAVHVERCAAGRLRASYPVGLHDLELQVDGCGIEFLANVLSEAIEAVPLTDPQCRRLVLAVPADESSRVAAAEAAGFRYVVNVDLGDTEHSLFAWEAAWVTRTDPDLDRVPDA
ncbi:MULTISPECIES: hypothetical protein [unclassified Streptomyces]|uniref:hypothetical protein n=1 Tax=unclassified Streptomyces TaxID=2593676 RepID=UPI00081F4E99|nr:MULTISPECIES: hypothetical protein [unclassified Streptomyces]MYZ33802.1 hypothetical protein [Streptomyces sp. SID4917]SCF61876.1 hypothetical protein GA0115259_100226 [Streptomyces sp. MnatMP-M17]